VRTIMRMIPYTAGRIEIDGRSIAGQVSHEVARSGLGLVPEGRRCFPNLTVEENLIAAARPGPWTLRTVYSLFERLGDRRSQNAASLSGGEQQMLAIGRALMTNPRLLILDEATEGLAPMICKEIWASLSQLKSETGLAMIVIDKLLSELSRVADRAVILENGISVWRGTFSQLGPDISDRFLGV
jgi:branched-chain amino acid transport system ATP-binding protein